jgi:hypothetical protein
MSILEEMVSTEKRYTSDNFHALKNASLRGEYLYRIRLYVERPGFQSEETGLLRMRMLLGFIEARAVVIDAIIRTEGALHYLSVLCSSMAAPETFSRIMKKTVPQAIIEETEEKSAEEWVASRSVRSGVWNSIPFGGAVRVVNESRRILVALLLEYRALLAECNALVPVPAGADCGRASSALMVQFLLFEQDGALCGLPDFQIAGISNGANRSHIIQLQQDFGQRLMVCDELICMKELGITDLVFAERKRRGFYGVSAPATGGRFSFTLVVPSFL